MIYVRSAFSAAATIHRVILPLFASKEKGSSILLSWTKKWICSQKDSVRIIFVNLAKPFEFSTVLFDYLIADGLEISLPKTSK